MTILFFQNKPTDKPMTTEFKPFPKMARLSREIIITEKIDGTNASIYIGEVTEDNLDEPSLFTWEADNKAYFMKAGSRTRWITPDNDNFGFAGWVKENRQSLALLGPGHHFGEWWGRGIQRGYGIKDRRFSLFNTVRWCLHGQEPQQIPTGDLRIVKMQDDLPPCCHLVPVLYRGEFVTAAVDVCLADLKVEGSFAAPGFMDPEGIVIFHTAANIAFKKTITNDHQPKSNQ